MVLYRLDRLTNVIFDPLAVDEERQWPYVALSLCQGALLDDLAQVVDDANANSMAASLVNPARLSKGIHIGIVRYTTHF